MHVLIEKKEFDEISRIAKLRGFSLDLDDYSKFKYIQFPYLQCSRFNFFTLFLEKFFKEEKIFMAVEGRILEGFNFPEETESDEPIYGDEVWIGTYDKILIGSDLKNIKFQIHNLFFENNKVIEKYDSAIKEMVVSDECMWYDTEYFFPLESYKGKVFFHGDGFWTSENEKEGFHQIYNQYLERLSPLMKELDCMTFKKSHDEIDNYIQEIMKKI